MKERRERSENEQIRRRVLSVARGARGRLYQTDEGLYLVRGEADFERLQESLEQVAGHRHPVVLPDPLTLGFAADQVGQVTLQEVASWGHSLQLLRRMAEQRGSRKLLQRGKREQSEEWAAEAEHLAARVREARTALEGTRMPGEARHIVPPEDQEALGAAMRATCAGFALPPAWEACIRLVQWIRDTVSAVRLLRMLRPYLRTEAQEAEAGVLKTILQRLDALAHMRSPASKPGPRRDGLETMSQQEVHRHMMEILQDVPGDVFEWADLPRLRRPTDVSLYELRLRERCDDRLSVLPALLPREAIGGLAALVAVGSDGGKVFDLGPFGPGCDEAGRPWRTELHEVFAALHLSRDHPGRDRMLEALGSFKRPVRSDEIACVCTLLHVGASVADIEWVKPWFGALEAFSEASLDPAPFRRLVARLQEAGVEFDGEEEQFLQRIAPLKEVGLPSLLCDWLDEVPARALTPSVAGQVKNILVSLIAPGPIAQRITSALQKWKGLWKVAAPEAAGDSEDAFQAWTRCLGGYQRLAGEVSRVPTGLQGLETRARSEEQERAYLRAARARGALTKGMENRLRLLDSRAATSARPQHARAIRRLRRTCAATALRALERVMIGIVEEQWAKEIGPVGPDLRLHHKLEVLAWLARLQGATLKEARAIIEAFRAHGDGYREVLPANAAWLRRAREAGVDVGAWLHPPRWTTTTNDRPLTIGLAAEPFSTFLMGTLFRTCLSLKNSRGEQAPVIANARDANKAVVFVWDDRGDLVARKLVCLNNTFGLIGYRLHSTLPKEQGKALEVNLGRYCGRWAGAARVPLSETGAPEDLGLDWYDDGVVLWDVTAHQAMAGWRPGSVASTEEGPQHTLLQTDVETFRRDLEAMLPQGGAQPLPQAMLEEGLALVAKRRGDEALAARVFRHASTEGARLEGLTSLARLRGPSFAQELTGLAIPWGRRAPERIARLLLEYDTHDSIRGLQGLAERGLVAKLWPVLAALRSHPGAQATLNSVRERIERGRYDLPPWHLLVPACERTLGSQPWGALAGAVLDRAHRDSDPFGPLQELEQLVFVLPPIERPQQVFKERLLSRLAGRSETRGRHWARREESWRITLASLFALRNPCSATASFLRDVGVREPVALICLALLDAKRHREHVLRIAGTSPRDLATGLAVVQSLGEKDGLALLWRGTRGLPNRQGWLDRLRAVHRGLSSMQGEGLYDGDAGLSDDEALATAPILVHAAWRGLEEAVRGAEPRCFAGEWPSSARSRGDHATARGLLAAAHRGFAARLCLSLATAPRGQDEAYATAIQRLSTSLLDDPVDVLVMDALAGGRLLACAKRSWDTRDPRAEFTVTWKAEFLCAAIDLLLGRGPAHASGWVGEHGLRVITDADDRQVLDIPMDPVAAEPYYAILARVLEEGNAYETRTTTQERTLAKFRLSPP